MPIILDHQLREQIPHGSTAFPITYFHDELAELPNFAGPLHWHPDFEIATAKAGVLDYQVGSEHLILEAGDSIFVNGNILHGIRQISGEVPDPMPNIVFSGSLVAPEMSAIYKKYVAPIAECDALPFIVFRAKDEKQERVNELIEDIYRALEHQNECYEMVVQRNLSEIFEYIARNFDEIPKSEGTRLQISGQIRIQKMLTYIYEHFSDNVTLSDIANAASISRSEAGRCFNTYMNCSPVDALIKHRLQVAYGMLMDKSLTLEDISFSCGFNSVSYFSRKFKEVYGSAPGKKRGLGK